MSGGGRGREAMGLEAPIPLPERLIVRALSPDGLGAFFFGTILIWTVGTPFPMPVGLAVLAMIAGVQVLGEAIAVPATVGFVAARLYASGVFENQSRVPVWRLVGQELPAPLFNADGAGMLFLVVFGSWGVWVLLGFHGQRARLRSAGVSEGDIGTLALSTSVVQFLSLTVAGVAMCLLLGVVS